MGVREFLCLRVDRMAFLGCWDESWDSWDLTTLIFVAIDVEAGRKDGCTYFCADGAVKEGQRFPCMIFSISASTSKIRSMRPCELPSGTP